MDEPQISLAGDRPLAPAAARQPRRRGCGARSPRSLAVAALAIVVWSVGSRGVGALNLDFFTKGPAALRRGRRRHRAGARRHRCCSSRSRPRSRCPFGVLTAIYVSEFAPQRIGEQVRLWLDVLNGFPSIVIGIFVFALCVKVKLPIVGSGHHQSAFAGGVRARDHHAAARRAHDDGGAARSSRTSCARRATRSASRSGRRCSASSCRRRSAASSPGTTLASRAQPARRRRCSSPARSPVSSSTGTRRTRCSRSR